MNIVFFHLNQIGDLLFSLPAVKCVRESFPGARLTSVVRPGMMELLRTAELVDSILPRGSGALAKLDLARTLAGGGFDMAISFSQSAECSLLARTTRAQRRIGFEGTSGGRMLTERVEFHHPPSTANNLRLIRASGCRLTCADYCALLKPSSDQIDRAQNLLSEHGISRDAHVVAMAPGTSSKRTLKRWAPDRFASVARGALDDGCRVVLVQGEPSPEITAAEPHIVDLGGKTGLATAAALLSLCKALVALDSGILHLGAAVGTRVIGLYGPSDPSICGPQGDGHTVLTSHIDCRPCNRTTCDNDARCMDLITADEVAAALARALRWGSG